MTAVRTRSAGVLVTSLLVAATAGCSSSAGPAPRPSPSTTSATSDPSTPPPDGPLLLAVHGVPAAVAAYEDAADAFTQETGVPVDVEVQGDAAAAARELQRDLQEGGRAPDVFLLDHEFLPDLVATDRLQRLDAALEERGLQFGDGYQRVALTAFSAEDVLQCMPIDMSPRVLFVNREHVRPRDLAIRGVPLPEEGQWQWEAFDAAARLIAREHQGEAGFRAVHLPIDMEVLTALVRSAGGEVVDDVDHPTASTVGGDDAVEVLQAYLRLARTPGVGLSGPEASRRTALERFGSGDLAMMIGTRADLPALRRTDAPFDVMALPSFGSARTVADIAGLCVDRRSDRVEEALDLVAFVAGNEGSTILARSGAVVPANLDVAFSPAFAQRGQRPRSEQVFSEALGRSGYMPFSSAWREVAGRVEEVLSRLLAGDRGVGRALEDRLTRIDQQSEAVFADDVSGGDTDG